MNYLAHLYLSRGDHDVMTGNFIADSVKGKEYMKFSGGIRKGILLHRAIDQFTDDHPVVLQSKERLRSVYGKHAGIVVDILYDHFLSVDWNRYSSENLEEFIKAVYILMIQQYLILPTRVKQYLPFMVVNNWLEKYIHEAGIERVLTGMSRRTSLPSSTAQGMQIFRTNYETFRSEFNLFFPELIDFSDSFSDQHVDTDS